MSVLITTTMFIGVLSINTTQLVNAEGSTYTLLEPLPKVTQSGQVSMEPIVSLSTYIQDAINLFIALSAVSAVFMIVWGGLEYMTTDSWKGKEDGIKKVKNAVIGLIMVLSTVLILKTVNPQLIEVAKIPSIQGELKTSSLNTFRNAGDIANTATANQLMDEANRLNAQAQNSVGNAQYLRTEVTNLQRQLDEKLLQYDSLMCATNFGSVGDPSNAECDSLNRDIANLRDQVSSTTATMAVSVNTAITTNDVSTLTAELDRIVQTSTLTSIGSINNDTSIYAASRAAINAIASTTSSRIAQLQQIPGSGAQVQQVQDQQQFANSQIVFNTALARQRQYPDHNGDITTNDVIPSLNSSILDILPQVRSQAVRQQIIALRTSTLSQLRANIR